VASPPQPPELLTLILRMEWAEYQKMYELEDSYWWFVGRRLLVAALIEQWMPPDPAGPILDVGCGTGGNLAFLARWGGKTGVDLSPVALDFARRRSLLCLVQASGLALPYPDSIFRLVTVSDVLYHRWAVDDGQVVRECQRVLQPGGWLLLSEPALPALWSRHDEVYYAWHRYTLDEIGRMLRGAGFRLCKLSYTNALLLPLLVVVRLVARWFPCADDVELQPLPRWLNQALVGVLSLEAVWLRWGTFPIGSSLVCLAQKDVKRET
jgi:SAM-dependent methyltransferase